MTARILDWIDRHPLETLVGIASALSIGFGVMVTAVMLS